MSVINYLSYAHSEGIMKALGMQVVTLEKGASFQQTCDTLKRKGVQILYVSEAIYEDYEEAIRAYDQDFEITIGVMKNEGKRASKGLARLNNLMKDAVGVSFEGRDSVARER